ncbi:MAG: hypothetical protein HDR17_02645 [Lachnospiraceae bacterium]|nr:hypothetical protein [Lachnospiraceae bacterium]
MGLRKSYLTADDLIDKKGKSESTIKAEKDKKIRTYRGVLKKLGFTPQMISWYRSGKNGSLGGDYIFAYADMEEINNKLRRLSAISDKTDKAPSYYSMCEIITILQELLPFSKKEYVMSNLPNEQTEEIKKLFSLINEMKTMKIFKHYKGSLKTKNELSKIFNNLEKIDRSKAVLLDNAQELAVMKEADDYEYRKRIICETVVAFFLTRMNNRYFPETSFSAQYNDKKLYLMVKKWCLLWVCLFESINELRDAEEFYNICELFERCGKNEEYKKQFFRNRIPMEDEIEEAYNKFRKLPIVLFARYYRRKYDNKKLFQMICDPSSKDLLKEEYEPANLWERHNSCNKFVECVGQWKRGEIYEEDMISMKVEALRELDMITKFVQNGDNCLGEENISQNIAGKDVEADRKKFVDYYNRYNSDRRISKECLECVFDIKHENGGLITDYMPYVKLSENFMEKSIVNECESEKE